MKLLNAFSLNMINTGIIGTVHFDELTLEEAKQLIGNGFTSAIGHESTARVFSDVLGADVAMNRMSVQLNMGEKALVGQYLGPRLGEGATELPSGARIQWILVTIP